jgi:ATP-dependent RNA helicase RhlE
VAIAFCAEDERDYLRDIRKKTDAEFERLPLPDNFRAVVEGVGPTKREQKPKLARPNVRPTGDGPAKKPKPKNKHPNRAGAPKREGGEGRPAGAPGGNRNRSRNRNRNRRAGAARG